MKKSKTISKFYTDENGQISFRIKEDDREKHKVTYFTTNKNDFVIRLIKRGHSL